MNIHVANSTVFGVRLVGRLDITAKVRGINDGAVLLRIICKEADMDEEIVLGVDDSATLSLSGDE